MNKTAFRDGDVISGGLLAALGSYIVLEARAWTYSGPEGPGPGFFPIWYGILMIGLSLGAFGLFHAGAQGVRPGAGESDDERVRRPRRHRVRGQRHYFDAAPRRERSRQ